MEFEKNKPTTQQDIVLANSAKVTLQPVHADIKVDVPSINFSHSNEAVFDFESETTDAAKVTTSASHPHTVAAAIISLAVAGVFIGGLALVYSLR